MYYVLTSQVLTAEEGSDVWPLHPDRHNRLYYSFLTLYFCYMTSYIHVSSN